VAAEIFTPGDVIPDYQATALGGTPAYFSDYAGKALVINFWATWYPPCRREMPLLESTYQKYKEQNVVFIGISVDESPGMVADYVKSVGVTYPIWENGVSRREAGTSDTAMSRLFGVVGFPTTYFVDPNGVIQSSYVGELNQAILDQRISALIP
jgi:thiol-disulfide isomerase/thioredoxin